MKKVTKSLFKVVIAILVLWGILTLIAEMPRGEESALYGKKIARKNAVVVYDPDPFYNLEEQISKSFAEGLAQQNWLVKVATVKSAKKLEEEFDLYVFCANTYNWAPDWAVTGYLEHLKNLDGKNAVAITVGSGSTARAARLLETKIKNTGAQLVDAREYWLMRPNDENRMDESNVDVAVDMAKDFGILGGRKQGSDISLGN